MLRCYLNNSLRQKQEENRKELRADIRLSKWYTETDEQLDKDIFSEIQGGVKDQTIIFRQWTDKEDLENTMYELNGYSEENGNLIVTEDLPNGGIDTQMIQEKIDEYFM